MPTSTKQRPVAVHKTALAGLLTCIACTGAPTDLETTVDVSVRLGVIPPGASPTLLVFDELFYEGIDEDGGDRLSLELSALDAVMRVTPPGATPPLIGVPPKVLSFFEEGGGKGGLIEGAGRIQVWSDEKVLGFGALLDVPVTGTRVEPNGTTSAIEGFLTIDLVEGVVPSGKGTYFTECGEDCLQFEIVATFTGAVGPSCLLEGAFKIPVPNP